MANSDIDKQLEEINQKLIVLNERLEKTGIFAEAEEVADGGYEAFEKRMNWFIIIMNAVFAFSTWLFYNHMPAFFPVSFGLLFVFLILAVGLAIDEYLLPTRTFWRISTNALAVSIFWFSIMFLAVSGVRIGMSIISDPFGGEEGRRSQPAPIVGEAPVSTTGKTPDSALYGSSKGPKAAGVAVTNPAKVPTSPATDASLQGSSGDSNREQ